MFSLNFKSNFFHTFTYINKFCLYSNNYNYNRVKFINDQKEIETPNAQTGCYSYEE